MVRQRLRTARAQLPLGDPLHNSSLECLLFMQPRGFGATLECSSSLGNDAIGNNARPKCGTLQLLPSRCSALGSSEPKGEVDIGSLKWPHNSIVYDKRQGV